MAEKLLDFIAKKVAERNSQLAAGNMTYYTLARTKNGTLSAVFAAADGARSYTLDALSENAPFEYMSDYAQRQSRIGLVKLVQATNRVSDGFAKVKDYPAVEDVSPAASMFYRELQFLKRAQAMTAYEGVLTVEMEQQEQEAAGEMFFHRVVRFGKSGRLGAVFAAADGAHTYDVEALADARNFRFMPKTAQEEAHEAAALTLAVTQMLGANRIRYADLPEEELARKEAGILYHLAKMAYKGPGE